MRFSLKQAMIGIAAVAIPLAVGAESARVVVCHGSDLPIFDYRVFGIAVAAELFVFAGVAIIRYADSARRKLDNPSVESDLDP